jgi:hypothetical protein
MFSYFLQQPETLWSSSLFSYILSGQVKCFVQIVSNESYICQDLDPGFGE